MKNVYSVIVFAFFLITCRPKEETPFPEYPVSAKVPSSIKNEHEKLLRMLSGIISFQDCTVVQSQKLDELLKHHFLEEEKFVLPSLGLLPFLVNNELPDNQRESSQLSDKLKVKLRHLNIEHQLIKAYIEELKAAAAPEKQIDITAFEKEIEKHASLEEEVLFPAALLVTQFMELKAVHNKQRQR